MLYSYSYKIMHHLTAIILAAFASGISIENQAIAM
jgi:hypothetical protein